jgi:hypothetical protein
MNEEGISDKNHAAAVAMYNGTIGTQRDSVVYAKMREYTKGKIIKRKKKVPDPVGATDNPNEICIRTFKPGKEIKLNPSDKLYHATDVDNLTELKPTFRGKNGEQYPNKRIYFWLNTAGSRQIQGKFADDEHVYEVINNPPSVKTDNEFSSGKAVYVETNTPIKVRKIK